MSTVHSQHVQRGQQAQHCLIGRQGQWSLTQCGQRQLPPSMLCSLLCPPGIVSIENAIYLYISVYLILPTALMESIAGCLPILATAHGLSLPHAMCKAVNPWSSCTICSSSCVFVHKCSFWQNFAHFINVQFKISTYIFINYNS